MGRYLLDHRRMSVHDWLPAILVFTRVAGLWMIPEYVGVKIKLGPCFWTPGCFFQPLNFFWPLINVYFFQKPEKHFRETVNNTATQKKHKQTLKTRNCRETPKETVKKNLNVPHVLYDVVLGRSLRIVVRSIRVACASLAVRSSTGK